MLLYYYNESEVKRMNCRNCFQEIPDGTKYCPHCGADQQAVPVNNYQNTPSDMDGVYSGNNQQNMNQQYQDNQNYGGGYQTPPQYQQGNQGSQINWVPYLVVSIITTLCCCLPAGIAGIVFSAKINSAMNAGDYVGAQNAAKTAKICIIVSVALGLIIDIIYIIYMVMAGSSSYYYYY